MPRKRLQNREITRHKEFILGGSFYVIRQKRGIYCRIRVKLYGELGGNP